jgi:hypothetical protein
VTMLNDKQREALAKLAVAPAMQNEQGFPLGVAKNWDGSTLNGNMINKLRELGYITKEAAGERQMYVRDIRAYRPVTIMRYAITPAGKLALETK